LVETSGRSEKRNQEELVAGLLQMGLELLKGFMTGNRPVSAHRECSGSVGPH